MKRVAMNWVIRAGNRPSVIARFMLRGDAMSACNAFNKSLRARKKWSSKFMWRYRKSYEVIE